MSRDRWCTLGDGKIRKLTLTTLRNVMKRTHYFSSLDRMTYWNVRWHLRLVYREVLSSGHQIGCCPLFHFLHSDLLHSPLEDMASVSPSTSCLLRKPVSRIYSLYLSNWNQIKDINEKYRLYIFKSRSTRVILYGAETWTTTKRGWQNSSHVNEFFKAIKIIKEERLRNTNIILKLGVNEIHQWVPVTTAWRDPWFAGGGVGLQIWRLAANILNKHSWTADQEWSSSLGVWREANRLTL